MPAKPLTKAEKQWIASLQAVLDQCPSDRLGAFTIGDSSIGIFCALTHRAWTDANPRADLDVGRELEASGADLFSVLRFPFNVDSRAG